MSHDQNRIQFHNILKQYGITHGTTKYAQLTSFLNDPLNSQYLQLYFLLCTGYLKIQDIIERTADLIAEFEFINEGNYTYRKLFNIDQEWYQYFRENAYPLGQRRFQDRRRGVDREKIDRIMELKSGPPEMPLEVAIVKDCQNTYGV